MRYINLGISKLQWLPRVLSFKSSHTPCHRISDARQTLFLYLDLSSISHEDTLEDLGQVTQVESVVRFGWSGQEARGDGGVHLNSGID